MKYKIGLILPDSNYFFRIGKDFRATVEAGLKKAGFDNYEIAIEPGGYNAEMKVVKEKIQSLIVKEQVDLIIAPFNPSFLVDIETLLSSNEVLLLLTYMGEDVIHQTYKSDYTFINTFDLVKSAWLQGYEAGNKYGTKAAYLGAIHDVGYGMSRALTMGFGASGGQFTFSTYSHKNSRTEAPDEPIRQVIEEKPDFVYAFYSGKEGISFVNTWDDMETEKPPLVPSYMLHGDDVLDACGEKMIGQKTIGCWDRDGDSEENVTFRELFEATLGKKAHPYGLLAYETVALLGKAIKQTGSGTPAPEILKKALTEVSFAGPRGMISFDADSRLSKTTDYEFEIVKEAGKIVRKKIREVEVPQAYHEFLAWGIKNLEKTGWTNPYLIG